MDTVRSGSRFRHWGLMALACGIVLGALGLSVSEAILPPAIMIVLFGMVLVVLGAVEDMSA